jgi:hypothetical protein
MIEYPGISNTEVRDNLEWFPDGQLETSEAAGADVPYELLIVHSGHDEYNGMMERREEKGRKVRERERENKREQVRGWGLARVIDYYLVAFNSFNPK